MEDEEIYLDLNIITITLDDDESPIIDLNGCHPLIAASIFRNAAFMLESIVAKPKIYSDNALVAIDEADFFAEFDDEEE